MLILFLTVLSFRISFAQKLLIPMDLSQSDHLKAYGIAYKILEQGINVEWLLNYRGGSFLFDSHSEFEKLCRVRGVNYEVIAAGGEAKIFATIEENNMETIMLEKAPKVAVYTPKSKLPWDDAVTLAMTYAEIPYEKIFDEEVLTGKLDDYDWLHLHHEDFTGQYSKFYASFANAPWYIEQQIQSEALAKKLGFSKVSDSKKAVAKRIKEYVAAGGFMFAMCGATDSFDIALSADKVDIAGTVYDRDPFDPNAQKKIDYDKTFAFKDFVVYTDPMQTEFSNIDTTPRNRLFLRGAESDYFSLFDFSAKYDPVPTMLTQNHTSVVKGFMGLTTAFKKELIKENVIILGESTPTNEVKYLHGKFGEGTFTFYGGHDPEDYTHLVGDPPTQLDLHKNSPGYRLILNNVLFPAAQKKPQKT
ncbi:MAG: asparagine synthetase B [Calditrichaeota bacterium]|nr:MAG: asparagine synthetase B [Calditrichota bacterium]